MALIVRLHQTNHERKVKEIYVNLDNVETIEDNTTYGTEIIFRAGRHVYVDEDFAGIFYPKDSNVIART